MTCSHVLMAKCIYVNILCMLTVDGGWANWADFSTCSRTCGCGSKIRFRSCTNPKPAEGGMDCVGDSAEAMECTIKNCPGL